MKNQIMIGYVFLVDMVKIVMNQKLIIAHIDYSVYI